MDVVIRRARTADAEAIARIHSRSYRTAYREWMPAPFLARLEPRTLAPRWARTIGVGPERVVIAEVGGRVTGFVTYGLMFDATWLGRGGQIAWLYVDPDAVGRGIGRRLLDHAIDALEQGGMLWLRLRVLEQNVRARRFYERAGLRLDGPPRIELVGGAPVAVVSYARALSPVVDWRALFAEDGAGTSG